MEKFIVSARKYRPSNFTTLIGQESIATTLKNSIKRGQLAHAYLFCGPRGVGKTSTARIFAKTINCMNPGADMEPCGECESCRSFAEGRSYCIHELDAASNNSVDDIRLLTEKVMIPPQIGKYSVYIIDEVHMLSSAAFNAFLKTLEEPPSHAIFILATTEKHKILPTILSRCQTYDFNRISIDGIVRNLTDIARKENISIDSDSLHVIAQKADGAMRDALTLFDQCVAFCGTTIDYASVIRNLNVLDYEYYFNLVESALAGNFSKALLLFDEILSKGFNALYFIGGLSNHLRNLLVCKDSSTLKLLEMAPAVAERYREQSSRCPIRFLYEALAATVKCESEYRQSSNQRLLVEFMLVKLTQLSAAPAIAAAPAAAAPAPSAAAPSAAAPVEAAPVKTAPVKTAPAPAQPAAAPIRTPEKPAASQPPAAASVPENPAPAASGSAAAAAPAPAQQAAAPAPAQTAAKSGGLSIKDIIRKSKATTQSVKQSIVAGNEPVTIGKVIAAWEKMAAAQKRHPRLSTAILQTKPILKEDNLTVIFEVGNSAQQTWIEKNSLPELTGFLHNELKNDKVVLKVEVAKAPEQEKKLYMPQEKANFLYRNHPELVQLSKDLDLDIK